MLEYLVLSKSFSILILDLLTLIDIRTFDATFIYDPNILKVSVWSILFGGVTELFGGGVLGAIALPWRKNLPLLKEYKHNLFFLFW